MIVLADEDHGRLEDGGEVHRLVEVAFGGGAIAEEGHHYIVLLPVVDAPSQPDRVEHLRANRYRDGQIADRLRDMRALLVTGVVKQHTLDAASTRDLGGGFPKRGHHPVRVAERADGADVGGFLPFDRRERADTALPLQFEHALVESSAQKHRPIERQQLLRRQLRIERRIHLAVFVENAEIIHLRVQVNRRSRHDLPPFFGDIL